MTCEKFESVIAYHCSPVLVGLKPANLVSFSKEKAPTVPELTESYTREFQREGICMEIICSCKKHYLVLVYRPQMLYDYLSGKEARSILRKDGYPEEGNLQELLQHLKKRFEVRVEFPHEIGLFLGYPLEDVKGFQKYKGTESKLCGYWKVYGDVESAKRTFASFDRCREFIGRQIQLGYSISQAVSRKHLCAV